MVDRVPAGDQPPTLDPSQHMQSDADAASLRAQLELAQWELDSRDATIEAMSRQLQAAERRVRALGPLESSAKLQLLALKRTLPLAARTRIAGMRAKRAARRGRSIDKEPAQRQPTDTARLLRGSTVTLAGLAERAIPQRMVHDPEGVRADLLSGSPLDDRQATAMQFGRHREWSHLGYPEDLLPTLHTAGETSEGNLEELVTRVSPDLVTIDIWDTLILRNRPPDASKTATARRMILMPRALPGVRGRDPFDIAAVRVEVEAELARAHPGEEYELNEVLQETLQRLGHPAGVACNTLARTLAQAEVDDEIAWSWVRQEVLHIAQRHGERAVLASDFYMTGEDLRRVVNEVTGQDLRTIVSIDRGLSKRLDGELLKAIRSEEGVSAAKHLHLGDNEHSDVRNQVLTGGRAIHVPRWSPFPGPGSFRKDDLASCWAELDRQLALYDAEHPTDSQGRMAGREAAIFAVALVARGLEEAWQRLGDRVHYVSREGIFLSEVHDLVEPILRPPGQTEVQHIHLALSRRATFGASLAEPVMESLGRMWSMYRRQTMSAMLISIGVDPGDLAGPLAEHGLTADTVVDDPAKDRRVKAFFDDPQARQFITGHIAQARDLLRDYVLSRTHLQSPFIVIDIGWRGTIQDNLVRALGVHRSTGVYFGLFPFLNEQPAGTTKLGVAFDGNAGDEFGFAHPPAALERPWTPDVPSTTAFRRNEDGSIEPVHEKEAGHVSAAIREFQLGTLEVAPIVARWLVGMGLTTSVLRHDLGERARNYWDDPHPGVADIWFDSDHDDSFGALNEVSFGKLAPNPDWFNGPVIKHIEAGEKASEWPAGYRSWRPVRSIIALAQTTIGGSSDTPPV